MVFSVNQSDIYMNFLGNLLVWNIKSLDGPYLQRVYKKINTLEYFTDMNKTKMFALAYITSDSDWVTKSMKIIVFNNDSSIDPCKISFAINSKLNVLDISDKNFEYYSSTSSFDKRFLYVSGIYHKPISGSASTQDFNVFTVINITDHSTAEIISFYIILLVFDFH